MAPSSSPAWRPVGVLNPASEIDKIEHQLWVRTGSVRSVESLVGFAKRVIVRLIGSVSEMKPAMVTSEYVPGSDW
jgi:hypothetical protein